MEHKETVIVTTVGGTNDPIIDSIKDYKPDLVIFIHSAKTFDNVREILKSVNSDFKKECVLVEDYQAIQDTYDVSNEILNNLNDENQDIIINFTGGTKAMASGLVLASIDSDVELKLIYVGTDSEEGRTKDGTGTVIKGYEYIKEQVNPYETYAVKEFKNGKRLFDAYQFPASLQNFEEALNKTSDSKYKSLADFYIKIVKFYDAWDKFNRDVEYFNKDLNTNQSLFLSKFLNENILKEINNDSYLIEDKKENPLFYEQMGNNLNFLRLKISNKNRKISSNINYYLPDLLNNAHRRIEEGKYDDAVARLYRAIELIAQLNLHNLDLIDVDVLKQNLTFFILKDSLDDVIDEERFKEFKESREYQNDDKHIKIPLAKSYDLLRLLNVELAEEYLDDFKLRNLVNNRNDSILAHGLKPINKDNALDLYDMVLIYARKLNPKIDKLMGMAKFPKYGV